MELIPILSLIILVATISTFILSVGAYILYKVRERKGVTAGAVQPSALPAELVTPAPLTASAHQQIAMEQKSGQPGRKTFEIIQPQQEYGYENQQRQQGYPQEQTRGPELRPTFVGSAPQNYPETRYQKPTGERMRTSESQRYTDKKKFMRYTNEGYVEPSRQDKNKEDNLRWR